MAIIGIVDTTTGAVLNPDTRYAKLSGTITNAVSSTDNAVALWNGTGGNALKDSQMVIDTTAISGGTLLNLETFTTYPPLSSQISNDMFFTFLSGQVHLNFNVYGTVYKVELSQ